MVQLWWRKTFYFLLFLGYWFLHKWKMTKIVRRSWCKDLKDIGTWFLCVCLNVQSLSSRIDFWKRGFLFHQIRTILYLISLFVLHDNDLSSSMMMRQIMCLPFKWLFTIISWTCYDRLAMKLRSLVHVVIMLQSAVMSI